MHVASIIFPNDAELNHTLGNLGYFKSLFVLGVLLEERAESRGDLVNCLLKFGLGCENHFYER